MPGMREGLVVRCFGHASTPWGRDQRHTGTEGGQAEVNGLRVAGDEQERGRARSKGRDAIPRSAPRQHPPAQIQGAEPPPPPRMPPPHLEATRALSQHSASRERMFSARCDIFDDCIILDRCLGEWLAFARNLASPRPPSRHDLRRMHSDIRKLDGVSDPRSARSCARHRRAGRERLVRPPVSWPGTPQADGSDERCREHCGLAAQRDAPGPAMEEVAQFRDHEPATKRRSGVPSAGHSPASTNASQLNCSWAAARTSKLARGTTHGPRNPTVSTDGLERVS